LALTGEKLYGADMIALGLATHYSMSGVRYFFIKLRVLSFWRFYIDVVFRKLKDQPYMFCFLQQHLDLVDERLAKLVTDDPSVIDSSLAQYGDMVYPDKTSIVHR
jgi:3-hydroxyisobutyryl-CoA hydrolase